MREKIIERSILGILIAHATNFIISLVISIFVVKDGNFHFARPILIEQLGGEIPAVILQAILLTIFGAIFGGAGLIYERDDWGLTKQTVVHFTVLVSSFLLFGGILRWYPFNFVNLIGNVIIFSIFYFLIWVALYMKIKNDIERVNRKIGE